MHTYSSSSTQNHPKVAWLTQLIQHHSEGQGGGGGGDGGGSGGGRLIGCLCGGGDFKHS